MPSLIFPESIPCCAQARHWLVSASDSLQVGAAAVAPASPLATLSFDEASAPASSLASLLASEQAASKAALVMRSEKESKDRVLRMNRPGRRRLVDADPR
jgi:hypothetical protein